MILERRHHARFALKGTAILLAGGHAIRSRLVNLSEGGFFASVLVTPPPRFLDQRVGIELRLDDRLARWYALDGKILRIEPERIAVSVVSTSTLVKLVDTMATASRARRRVIAVVLIDEDPARRERLADAFFAAGCGVIEAATSLEAIVRLGESSFEPDVIAVGDSIPAQTADAMREFVERQHPNAKLVSITDVIDPSVNIFQLTPEDLSGNLVDAIRRLLGRHRATP